MSPSGIQLQLPESGMGYGILPTLCNLVRPHATLSGAIRPARFVDERDTNGVSRYGHAASEVVDSPGIGEFLEDFRLKLGRNQEAAIRADLTDIPVMTFCRIASAACGPAASRQTNRNSPSLSIRAAGRRQPSRGCRDDSRLRWCSGRSLFDGGLDRVANECYYALFLSFPCGFGLRSASGSYSSAVPSVMRLCRYSHRLPTPARLELLPAFRSRMVFIAYLIWID